ncbi:hypothetical protein [Paraburkholderia antibiotica]|uniref:Uncharacterized protein n=1 Tax=Paraburkholderia antibiotica TaxID=2728839 RepID=A0A7X9X5P1_9BURK|nr:hypothetical protein [Paraburkholderia antibiotica]NML31948.1 hypothetical protein [Paraburkholderia antibiotica]
MNERYYVAMAASVDSYEQSDYLCFIQVEGSGVIGYAAEFDSCTTDIADACVAENTQRARWFAWDDGWEWRAATLEEIKALKLDKYLIGSKKDMKLSTPIEPL